MSTKKNWFAVDADGLRKLIEHRGKAMVLYELVQNAWDAPGTTHVDITATKLEGRPFIGLVVNDDSPDGFKDLTHAYTLFAESVKKGDPELRGRFNVGEKFVLALCKNACVASTTGTVAFNEDGSMTRLRTKTAIGSEFRAEIRMNHAEYDEFCAAFDKMIPPDGIKTTFNGKMLDGRLRIGTFRTQLPTIIGDDEGILRATHRVGAVDILEVKDGETAMIYEMGIPIVETGDTFHVNVHQKVPLNMDRDNVTPAYLRQIRAEVLNFTSARLTKEQASEAWVTNALESKDIEPDAVVTAMTKRFGEKRASYDPTDREANMALTGRGFTVVTGASLPKAAWANVRAAGALVPAGRLAPTPVPYSTSPDAEPVEVLGRDAWTNGMRQVEEITRWAAKVCGVSDDLLVSFVVPPRKLDWAACFGNGSGLDYNVTNLGRKWFETWHEHSTAVLDLIIHELAHSKSGNHLDERYYKACTEFGAKLTLATMRDPKTFPHSKLLKKAT